MAKKTDTPPKQRWYKLLAQAYSITARHDKALLPILLFTFIVIAGAGVVIGLAMGTTVSIVYGSILGVVAGAVAAMFVLTRRFERTMFAQMESQMGGSIAVAQTIRMGWAFADEPVAIDPRTQSVVFQGVGKGGIVLLGEGPSARKLVDQTKSRFSKLTPNVPITPLFVGPGEGQVSHKKLTRAIRGVRRQTYGGMWTKGLSSAEQLAVRNRLKALGGPRVPVPKGIDPLKARADRKGMKGR